MRIGLDARILPNQSDKKESEVALYAYNLIKAFVSHDKENQYVLFFDSRVNKKETEQFKTPNTELVYFPFSTYKKYLSYAYSQFIVSGFLSKQRLDVFHACAGTMPFMYSEPTILTLFTLETKGLEKVAQGKIIKKAKIIIAKGNEMKKKIIDMYKTDNDRILTMEECGILDNKTCSDDCIKKYLEIYTVAHNTEIKDSYLSKLSLPSISTVATPIKKIVGSVGKIAIYPVKSISKLKKKKK